MSKDSSVQLSWVLGSLTPTLVKTKEINSSVLKLLIVSEDFNGLTLDERMNIVDNLLKKSGTHWYRKYSFIYEPFTAQEMKDLKVLFD